MPAVAGLSRVLNSYAPAGRELHDRCGACGSLLIQGHGSLECVGRACLQDGRGSCFLRLRGCSLCLCGRCFLCALGRCCLSSLCLLGLSLDSLGLLSSCLRLGLDRFRLFLRGFRFSLDSLCFLAGLFRSFHCLCDSSFLIRCHSCCSLSRCGCGSGCCRLV